jgi:hypothetical protein
MPVTPTEVTHAAHLSRCLGHVAYQLRPAGRQRAPDDRGLDVNAEGRGDTSVTETIPRLPETPEPVV